MHIKEFTLNSGNKMPIIGLGTSRLHEQITEDEFIDLIVYAIEIGYRHIDCARYYNNQTAIGKAIQIAIKNKIVKREDLFITSKLWNCDHEPKQVLKACSESLQQLQLDYLDLYLIHWPIISKNPGKYEIIEDGKEYLPIEEIPLTHTWHACEDLVHKNIVNSIGVSNFSIKDLTEIIKDVQTRKSNGQKAIIPSVNQIECHPLLSQERLHQFCKDNGILLTAYAPLGRGGKKGSDYNLLDNPTIKEIANEINITVAQVILGWLVQREISVIPKSSNKTRLKENLDTLMLVNKITKDHMNKISSLNINHRFIDGSQFTVLNSPYTKENIWDEGFYGK